MISSMAPGLTPGVEADKLILSTGPAMWFDARKYVSGSPLTWKDRVSGLVMTRDATTDPTLTTTPLLNNQPVVNTYPSGNTTSMSCASYTNDSVATTSIVFVRVASTGAIESLWYNGYQAINSQNNVGPLHHVERWGTYNEELVNSNIECPIGVGTVLTLLSSAYNSVVLRCNGTAYGPVTTGLGYTTRSLIKLSQNSDQYSNSLVASICYWTKILSGDEIRRYSEGVRRIWNVTV